MLFKNKPCFKQGFFIDKKQELMLYFFDEL